MPTTRPRHQVTETPAVARALDLAAQRWPNESRSRLLMHLVSLATDLLEGEADEGQRQRRDAVQASSGKYDDAFYPGFLEDLRKDWPA